METKMTTTYATHTLGGLQKKCYTTGKLAKEYHDFIKMKWRKYLDECFIIQSKEESNLNISKNILNARPGHQVYYGKTFFRNSRSR